MIFKANIIQHTGEDWNDVAIALETAAPSIDSSPPELFGQFISKQPPMHTMRYGAPMMQAKAYAIPPPPSAAPGVVSRSRSAVAPDAEPQPPVPKVQATFNQRGASSTFMIPGKQTIPSTPAYSEKGKRTLTVTEMAFDAVIERICVPKKTTQAFLRAQMKNISEFLLLEGNASVFVDGSL